MSSIVVWLLVLACGWSLYSRFLPTKAIALRNEGHPQYFGAALGAAYIACLAIFLHATCLNFSAYQDAVQRVVEVVPRTGTPDSTTSTVRSGVAKGLTVEHLTVMPGGTFQQLERLAIPPATKRSAPKIDSYSLIIAIGLWSSLLVFIVPEVLNLPFYVNKRLGYLTARKAGSAVERMLLDIFQQEKSVAFTLQNGKVYIGFPVEVDANGDEPDWVVVQPLASGYRTSKGELNLTTSYENAYNQITQNGASIRKEDFKVTLPLQHIVTIQGFNLEFYVEHFLTSPNEASADSVSGGESKKLHESNMTGNNYELSFADNWCRFLKWCFYASVTLGVVISPFSIHTSVVLGIGALVCLYFLKEPVVEKLDDFLEAMRHA